MPVTKGATVTDRRLHLVAMAVASLTGLMAASAASSFPSAQVNQTLQPDFGALLRPPEHRAYRPAPWRQHRRPEILYSYGPGYGPEYPGPAPFGPPPLSSSITVDCADPAAGPNSLNRAVAALADGGVLYIRTGGRACHESLEIDHPVVIVGEGASDFGEGAGPARLTPPPGAPCIRVAPGVGGVEIAGTSSFRRPTLANYRLRQKKTGFAEAPDSSDLNNDFWEI